MRDGLTEEQQAIYKIVESHMVFVATMPEPDKSRCLLSLAYEYFILDMEEEAFKLLEQADSGYFQEQLESDVDSIDNMKEIVTTIMSKLIEIGYIRVKLDAEER